MNLNDAVHSFRIPIAIILGYAELLAKGEVPDEATRQAYIEKIYEQGQLLDVRLSRLSDAAELSGGRLRIARTPIDVQKMLLSTCGGMEQFIESTGSRIRVESGEEPIVAEIDAVQVIKVLHNLTENAVKYMGRPGEIVITASKAGRDLLIVFRDNGRGMPAEDVSHIFEQEWQGENRVGGSGFGLYHARLVMEAHGGGIFARGGEGRGLAIYMRFPNAVQGRV
ncbi:MAG: HAMP domain-containing histidine kinase [Clostridiales Family XIII bacterium]|jgi:signal transduction histidine kinase|nr:HAMP domain-containing histidine kinase [Clostridiales Family XIII bacterium]